MKGATTLVSTRTSNPPRMISPRMIGASHNLRLTRMNFMIWENSENTFYTLRLDGIEEKSLTNFSKTTLKK